MNAATTKKTGTAKRAPARKPAAAKEPPASKEAVTATAKAKPTTAKARKPAVKAPRTLAEFMALALVMETDAAQRYDDFADAMEMHNNRDVAALFRKMAEIEGKHATQIMAAMGWKEMPALPPGKPSWEGFEAPETAAGDDVHYLMQPFHALELALANEQRAERFFARLAAAATVESVRKAARELQKEEREHVALVKAWMKKVPKPDSDWANDPDPPRYTD